MTRRFVWAAFLLSTFFCSFSHAQTRRVKVVVVHANDFYDLAPSNETGLGGISRFATLLEQDRANHENFLLFFAGDYIGSPSPKSKATGGAHVFAGMKTLKPDVVAFGNHETDYGLKNLRRLMHQTKLPFVSTNFIERMNRKPFGNAKPDMIFEFEGVRIGVLALLTQSTRFIEKHDRLPLILDPIEAAQNQVQKLKARGADYVIAVTHLNLQEDRRLAREVPEINLIIGGHEHEVIDQKVGHAWILKRGSDLAHYGRVTLNLEVTEATGSEPRKVDTSLGIETLVVDASVPEQPRAARLVKEWEGKILKSLQTILELKNSESKDVVAEATSFLNGKREVIRRHQTSLGVLIADIFREEFKADVGLIPSGNIRASIETGPITVAHIREVLPYNKEPLVMMAMPGRVLRGLLEVGLAELPDPSAHYLQTSGIKLVYDLSQPAGARIVELKIRRRSHSGFTEVPVSESEIYTVALDQYITEHQTLRPRGIGYDLAGAFYLKGFEPKDKQETVIRALRKKQFIRTDYEERVMSCEEALRMNAGRRPGV
ncbi:MAG: bifunctional UDP-sugar hydrolase/5'-nucleotidase [Bdellovibrionota bacterium]